MPETLGLRGQHLLPGFVGAMTGDGETDRKVAPFARAAEKFAQRQAGPLGGQIVNGEIERRFGNRLSGAGTPPDRGIHSRMQPCPIGDGQRTESDNGRGKVTADGGDRCRFRAAPA